MVQMCRQMCERGVVRTGEGIILVIPNKDINDIVRMTRKFRCISWWSYWKSITRNENTRRWISWHVIWNFNASILGNMLMGKGAMRAGKGTGRTRRGYNAMIHMSKIF